MSKKKHPPTDDHLCPCGTSLAYTRCCGYFHQNQVANIPWIPRTSRGTTSFSADGILLLSTSSRGLSAGSRDTKLQAESCSFTGDGYTAETLMRSRYTAYVMKLEAYLLETWHTSTRPPFIDFSDAVKWLGLSIKRCEQLNEQHAIVEFVARYKIHGRAYRLHEISRFLREHERWYYVDGDVL